MQPNTSVKKSTKKIIGVVKIQIKAQKASPAPPIGPAVGQYGINIMGFCKEFNERTSHITESAPVPIILTIYQDKSFTFIIKSLPTSYLIRQYVQKDKGGQSYLLSDDVYKIIALKREDLTAHSDQAAFNTIVGTAKSMNIFVQE